MAPKIQHKRSAVASKAPLPTDLEYGEIAVNYEKTDPALYLKDSDNIIRRIGAPPSDASETAKGIVELATAAETTAGADSSRAVHPAGLKVELDKKAPLAGPALTGTPTAPTAAVGTDTTQIATTAFVKAAQTASSPVGSPTAPTAPTAGQVWVDSSSTPSTIKVWNGTAWIPQTGSTVTSATAPATPAAGQVWVDTSATPNVTKIWDGTAWVTTTPDAAATAALANDAKYATKAELATENTWDRTGTTLSPANAGDQVHTATGKLTVGGTAAAPSIEIKADGGIVANTNGLVYDAATKRLAIGTTSPSQLLHLNSSTAVSTYSLYQNPNSQTYVGVNAAGDAVLFNDTAGRSVFFATAGLERGRFDASGRFLVGTSSARSNFNSAFGGYAPIAQIETVTASPTGLSIYNNNSSGYFPKLVLGISAGSSLGSNNLVADTNTLGVLSFQGSDGSKPVEAATIKAVVDGTPGANDMPGRLVFSTTADGASSPTERMRITSDGLLTQNAAASVNNCALTLKNIPFSSWGVGPSKAFGNFYVVNSAATGVYLTDGGTSWTASSDERLKTDLIPIENGLAKVGTLRAVTGRYLRDLEGASRSFLIAQDVQAVLPEAVDASNPDSLGVAYTEVIPLLVSALKEAKGRIETLEAAVTALQQS